MYFRRKTSGSRAQVALVVSSEITTWRRWLRCTSHSKVAACASLPKRTRDLNRWIARYGDRPMADIRRGDVVNFLDRLEASNGVNAAESALVAFRRLANWYSLRNEDYTSPVVGGISQPRAWRKPAICRVRRWLWTEHGQFPRSG
jgi:hypothetical protein